MPLLWTLKTSSAAPMRDKLIFFMADVIASFDTVDRGILDCASGRWLCPVVFGGFILVTMLGSSFGSSLRA